MKRLLIPLTLLLLLFFTTAGWAQGVKYTSVTATFDTPAVLPPLAAPLPRMSVGTFDNDGRLLLNLSGPFGNNNTSVRSIGAMFLTSATVGGNQDGTGSAVSRIVSGPNGGVLVVHFALLGQDVTTSLPFATASFSQGSAQVVELPFGQGFSPSDISSWGIGETPLASYELGPSGDIISGITAGILDAAPEFFAAEQTNLSSVNTVIPQLSQGMFIFTESESPEPPPTAPNDLLDTSTLDLPLVGGFLKEGIYTELRTGDSAQNPADSGAEETLLNDLWDALLGQIDGFSFANFGAGDATDFDPGNVNTGQDVVFNAGGRFVPVVQQAIPEPSSVLLWVFAAMTALAVMTARKWVGKRQ